METSSPVAVRDTAPAAMPAVLNPVAVEDTDKRKPEGGEHKGPQAGGGGQVHRKPGK